MPAYVVAASTNLENLEPLEFMQRLAALVPRRRLHLIRFHGVLVPNRSCALKSFPVRQSLQPRLNRAVTQQTQTAVLACRKNVQPLTNGRRMASLQIMEPSRVRL